ncbi:hypothetical protein SOVF_201780 [Spinacia oleracea]|uniref:Uncharacterized protein isoform X2 n=1 Tax=Spinacia oleracea TaxID=3562 RepID=A0A9R0IC20_SPIOL|nr:uncharacterized protein LOC110786346 isoform X2 [Spinacia oleracea]KNA04210.1 hypothetical protein SOVF_201780 [Spinacia oleracea]
MARCFPFPPPGYAGKCSSHEALILSIKLQKEKEKANLNREVEKCISERGTEKSKASSDKKKDKEDRKEKKRDREDRKEKKKDKEERKKEKKEKKREKRAKEATAPAESGKQGFADKLLKTENVLAESKGKLAVKGAELLERSSVTEEHGRPIDSQNAPCSSDSTGNSGKRKRSMPSPSGIQSNGNIIRIRLSTSQKREEPSTSGSKGQEFSQLLQTREDPVILHSQVRPCVSSVRPDTSIRGKDVSGLKAKTSVILETPGLDASASTSSATLQLVPADVSCLKAKTTASASQKEIPSSHDKIQSREKLEKLSSHDKRVQKKELTCKKLFVDWVPPPLEITLVVDQDDDEDWLFGKKGGDKSTKRLRVSDDGVNNLPCSASAVMQPRAHFLADAGIYALPFTVPY